MQFDFRAPGHPASLAQLIQLAVPAADLEELLEAGAVTVVGLRRLRPNTPLPSGCRIRVDWQGALPAASEDPSPFADWRVLVPSPAWQQGELESTRKLRGGLRFERLETRGGLSELRVETQGLSAGRVQAALAAFGHPVVGDLRRGGIAVAGGPRLEPLDAPSQTRPEGMSWWPEVVRDDGPPPAFLISQATQRALDRGHPWVLSDSETDDVARFAAGELVCLVVRGGRETEVLARVEDGGRVAARVWSRRGSSEKRTDRIEERVSAALKRRRFLLEPSGSELPTDALRLIHGEADGLPGLAIDRLGPMLRVLITGRAAEQIAPRALDSVLRSLSTLLGPEPPVVEVVHLRDRPPGRFTCARLLRGSSPVEAGDSQRLQVVERGLSFWVDPGLSQPHKATPGVGLYLDQRQNRQRLADRARGGRWLNLFAHTGAFSLALLEAGAEEVVSVDLSARVLRWLAANLEINPQLDASRHRSVCGDGRHFLDASARGKAAQRFDGIVIDPPTAAAGGRGYWKLGRDLPPLVEASLSRLEPGGTLFVSRNDRGRRQSAVELVRAAAAAAGVEIEAPESAPPGSDFPRLNGFPEGDSFDAAIVRRALRGNARKRR